MRLLLTIGLWLLLVLTACQSAAPMALEAAPGATSTVGGAAAAPSTPVLGIDLRVPPTRAPRPTPAIAPAAAAVVSPPPVASATVTLADDGRIIMLQPGQRALVNLGDELDWTMQVEDESIVSRVPGVAVPRGAQGMYQANRVGQTALRATGDPVCRKAQPACAQPSRAFTLTIAVQ